MTTIDVIPVPPALLGECPIWSELEQVLWWIDIDGHLIHRHDPATGSNESRNIGARPGSIALTTTPGRLLVAVEHELAWFDWTSGETEPWIPLETQGVGVRLNDGRTDPAGRFVVGSMFEDTSERRRDGSLHSVGADGAATVLRREVGVSNGLVFDDERSRMYWADTHTSSVTLWDYDAATGQRENERMFFDYSTVHGYPDGACLDAEGCYWSASVRGWALTRITPDGEVDRQIELPVQMPTMPAFGGPDLDMLFVTSIGGDGPSESGRDGVANGSLLVLDAGVRGISEVPFAG